MKKLILGMVLVSVALLFAGHNLGAAAPAGKAHLVLQQQQDNTWMCTFGTLYVNAGAQSFEAAGLNSHISKASQAACITWGKAVIAALDTGNNIPANQKSYEAHSKHSSGSIE